MVTAREAFEARKLAQKYGVIGKVAGSYRTAGYNVKIVSTDDDAPYNFEATKRGEKLLVKVYSKTWPIPPEIIDKLSTAGEGKKILALYGAGPRVAREVIEKAKESGVSIRRVRA
jgi:hypothetical protein